MYIYQFNWYNYSWNLHTKGGINKIHENKAPVFVSRMRTSVVYTWDMIAKITFCFVKN